MQPSYRVYTVVVLALLGDEYSIRGEVQTGSHTPRPVVGRYFQFSPFNFQFPIPHRVSRPLLKGVLR